MSNEQTLKMTELDYLTAAPHLQMIKAALPYINIQEQRILSLLVKIGELQRTVQLFGNSEEGDLSICSLEEDAPASPVDMLNAMKPFGTEAEQDFIDLIVNFLQGSQLYQSYMDSMDEPDQEIPRREPEHVQGQEHRADSHTGYSSAQNYQGSQNSQGNQNGTGGQNSSGGQNGSGGHNGQNGRRNDFFRFPMDQLKNILPPDQQSRLETAQMLMQTFQQFS